MLKQTKVGQISYFLEPQPNQNGIQKYKTKQYFAFHKFTDSTKHGKKPFNFFQRQITATTASKRSHNAIQNFWLTKKCSPVQHVEPNSRMNFQSHNTLQKVDIHIQPLMHSSSNKRCHRKIKVTFQNIDYFKFFHLTGKNQPNGYRPINAKKEMPVEPLVYL